MLEMCSAASMNRHVEFSVKADKMKIIIKFIDNLIAITNYGN